MRILSLIASISLPLFAFAEENIQSAAEAPVQVPGSSAAAATASAPQWTNFIFIGGLILFMWLFVFRPQSKRAKEQRDFLSSLKPDMEVYTSGGLIGSITEVKENVVILNIGTSNIKVLKSSIAGKLEKSV